MFCGKYGLTYRKSLKWGLKAQYMPKEWVTAQTNACYFCYHTSDKHDYQSEFLYTIMLGLRASMTSLWGKLSKLQLALHSTYIPSCTLLSQHCSCICDIYIYVYMYTEYYYYDLVARLFSSCFHSDKVNFCYHSNR